VKYQCVECKAEWPESQSKELLCPSCGGVLLPLMLDDQAHMYPDSPFQIMGKDYPQPTFPKDEL
jgi:hypothetical protein